jgi:hypothetical protein
LALVVCVHYVPFVLQANLLVVPLDLDTDLDLSKSKLTSSLSHFGGNEMQRSVDGTSAWTYMYVTEDFEKNLAKLADRRILMGSAGHLRARKICYVYIPPWGPDVQEVSHDLQYIFLSLLLLVCLWCLCLVAMNRSKVCSDFKAVHVFFSLLLQCIYSVAARSYKLL